MCVCSFLCEEAIIRLSSSSFIGEVSCHVCIVNVRLGLCGCRGTFVRGVLT